MRFGEFGIWTTFRAVGEENGGGAAALVEELGYGTLWLGGSPRLPTLRPLLEATERIVVATSVVNIWKYDPAELAAEYAALAAEFGDRLAVGIGVGHPEATGDYRRPLSAMREFLDALDAALRPLPAERRCLAALGPKMLELSRERALGSIPYFVPVEHTRFAREQLGPEALLAPELACVLEPDPARGRARAREYAATYLPLSNYTRELPRFGFGAGEIEGGGSDRLIDAIVPHGDAATIAAVARAHRDAGADHVVLQTVAEPGLPRQDWAALASALNLEAP